MKSILIAIFLLNGHFAFVQNYLAFKVLDLHTQMQQMNYVDQEIGKLKKWTSKKIELISLKIYLLNREGDYEKSTQLLKSITENKVYANPGAYYLSTAILKKYESDFESSYHAFKKAQNSYRKEKKYGWLADAFVEEAEFHRKFAQFEIGLNCIDSAAAMIKKHKCDPWVKIKMLNRYAAIANEHQQTERSCIAISREAIKLAEEEKSFYWMALSNNEIGANYFKQHNKDSAIFYTEKAEILFRELGFLHDAIHAKYNRACFHDNADLTINLLDEIVEETNSKGIKYPMGYIYNGLTQYNKLKKNYKAALENFELENEWWRAGLKKDQEVQLAKIADDFKSVKLEGENNRIKTENQHNAEIIKSKQVQFYSILIFTFLLILSLIILIRNVLKRRKLNKELQLKNIQKDILIQEVHHRVKNNLQFVKSILLFQSTKESENDQTLKDISRRIDAISLVHELLYSKDDSNEISVKEYLQKLIQYSEDLYLNSSPVQMNLSIQDINLPIQKLECIGIICSELLSNSIKYAFGNSTQSAFNIELTHLPKDKYLLHVYDNGRASSKGIQEDGLGIKMIDIYSRQMKGEYSLERENGYHYRLKFRIK